MEEPIAEKDVDALADMLDRWERGLDGANETDHWADRLARALLASDWLRERLAKAWDEGHAVGIRPYGDHANPYVLPPGGPDA